MASPTKTLFRGSFHEGFVRDTARHLLGPAAVFNAQDYLLHIPGVAEKRAGWKRQSLQLGSADEVGAVVTFHNPTKVAAVTLDGTVYDVTSENALQADTISGSLPVPIENPPLLYGRKRIFCDSTRSDSPQALFWNFGGNAWATIGDVFTNTPPNASRSLVYNDFLVLANDSEETCNVLYFWPDPDLEPDVDTAEVSLPVTGEVIGLAQAGGVLLVFGADSIERIVGSIPPGRVGEDMALQPLAGVGTIDARSVVHFDGSVVFANAEGVWKTTGSGVDSLTQGTIGATFWRDLFPEHTFNEKDGNQIAAGALRRDFYVVSLFDRDDTPSPVETLMCHVPTRTWTRVSNTCGYMFAGGRDEQELPDLYMASLSEGYVEKLAPMLRPGDYDTGEDGDGTAVEPVLEVTFGDAGPLKNYGGGRVTYLLSIGAQDAWVAAHVYALADQVGGNGQVFEVTARADDFKSGSTEPDWTTADDVGDMIVDNNVTWTNLGPQLTVATAQGVEPGSFTDQITFTSTETISRSSFPAQQTRQQLVSVRLTQSGASGRTAVYGVEVDVTPQEGNVVT